MNKMVIDREEFIIDNYDGEIEIIVDKSVLTIKGHVILKEWINDSSNLDLTINMEDNAELVYERFGITCNNSRVVINQCNNSKVNFKESFIANTNSKLKIENNITGNNNISEVIARLTAKENSEVVVDATLNVLEGTVDNEVKEDLKGLELENSKIVIIPNMLVASEEVMANHFVSIGNVSEEDLFYLTSKGLSENNARKLLETGFLISEFNDEELKDKIKEFIK